MASAVKDYMLLECQTYEDYLDSLVVKDDVRFLRNISCCRHLVTLGYRSHMGVLTEPEFELRKAIAYEYFYPSKTSHLPFSMDIEITDPVLQQLALREKANTDKKISTIIFYKGYTRNGFEISSFIDFENSLRNRISKVPGSRDWKAIFEGKEMLLPKSTDLSYYHTQGKLVVNDTNNYKVYHDGVEGVMFMYKGDRKVICPDVSNKAYKANCMSSMHYSDKYRYMIFYDHIIRKKV